MKFRKTKYNPLISIKIHFLIQMLMHHSELFHHVENFKKKRFLVEKKAKYFFIRAKMWGVKIEWREAWWRHGGWETSLAGPGGNSANPEARRSFLRGSWRLCTPSLISQRMSNGPKAFFQPNRSKWCANYSIFRSENL